MNNQLHKQLHKQSVVIAGRTNVGKSTLFNRLSSDVKSLTLDYAGVTRDIVKDTVEWNGKSFELIDTGGVNIRKLQQDEVAEKVRQQVLAAINQATVVILVIDATLGIVQEDRDISALLHSLGKKVVVAMNKTDVHQAQEYLHEGYALGHDAVIGISAQHGKGVGELLNTIVSLLPVLGTGKEEQHSYKVALLGRPNVGKSSLMNALLKEERSIVADVPGTTRESITESITFYKENIALTDTPGIRRKRAIDTTIETLMIKNAFQSIKDADIVLLLIDATEGTLVDQDLKLAFYAFSKQFKSLIILVNKSDIATPEHKENLDRSFKLYKHLINKVPVLHISAKTGKNIGHIVPLIHKVWQHANTSWQPAELMALFAQMRKTPLVQAKRVLKVRAAYQLKKAPLTIILGVNEPALFAPSSLSFLEKKLREAYTLDGAPIRFILRKYEKKADIESTYTPETL